VSLIEIFTITIIAYGLAEILDEYGFLLWPLLLLPILIGAIGIAVYGIFIAQWIPWDAILFWIVVFILFGYKESIQEKLGFKRESENITKDQISDSAPAETRVHFRCPECQTKYSALPAKAGSEGTCKNCGTTITVPNGDIEEGRWSLERRADRLKRAENEGRCGANSLCDRCGGTGNERFFGYKKCNKCEGTGVLE
jgi:ribosomal protein S27E